MKNNINESGEEGDYGFRVRLEEPPPQSQKERTWFRQKPYVFITAGLLILYSLIASKSPEILATVDYFLTPIIDSLRFIGLGITKPFMDGPMPERFYTNMVGTGVWGVVAYNLRSVLWFVMRRGRIADRREVWDQKKDKWGVWGVRLAIVGSVLLAALFASYCTLTFLNGINGWFVFHVRDFIVPPACVMMWVFPGAFITALGWSVIWYVGYMFLRLYQSLFSRE